MQLADRLLTAEEYSILLDDGVPNELVRGRVVPVDVPSPRHGQICAEIIYYLGRLLDSHDVGHLVCSSAVITERNPDTVRGADVSFYSYNRAPPGPLPHGYLEEENQILLPNQELILPDVLPEFRVVVRRFFE